jgi:cation transporter-like permease
MTRSSLTSAAAAATALIVFGLLTWALSAILSADPLYDFLDALLVTGVVSALVAEAAFVIAFFAPSGRW